MSRPPEAEPPDSSAYPRREFLYKGSLAAGGFLTIVFFGDLIRLLYKDAKRDGEIAKTGPSQEEVGRASSEIVVFHKGVDKAISEGASNIPIDNPQTLQEAQRVLQQAEERQAAIYSEEGASRAWADFLIGSSGMTAAMIGLIGLFHKKRV